MRVAVDEPGSTSWQRVLLAPRPLIGLVLIYGASRAIGLLREIGVAYYFGTTVAADRFSAAFAVASIAGILAGETAYGSTLRRITQSSGEHRAQVGEALGAALRLAVVAVVLFGLLGPAATLLLLGGDELGPVLAISLALAVSVGALVVMGSCNALLTFERRFAVQGGLQMLYSVGALVALGSFLTGLVEPRPVIVALGWAAGNVVAMLIALAVVGVRSSRHVPLKRVLGFARVGLPLAVAYFLMGLHAYVAQALGARLGTGRVAALNYADRLFLLPVGFVLAVLGPVVLGAASNALKDTPGDLPVVIKRQLRLVTMAIVPVSLLFAAVAPVLVEITFDRGAFNASSLARTQAALDGLAPAVVPVCLVLVGLRLMQALLPFRTIVAVTLGSLVAYTALALALSSAFALFGVTAAFGAAAVLVFAAQLHLLSQRFGRAWRRTIASQVFAPVLASATLTALIVGLDRSGSISQAAREATLLAGFALTLVAASVSARRT